MVRDIRIVFMGTPDFAVGILKSLLEHKFNVVGVVTAPDRPSGRGQKMNESAVKKFALEQNLHILQPTNLKDENFLAELKNLQANLQIVVAFRMLPKHVWQLPTFGTFNLHASLLPEYRGAAPINWAIINGETKTGVTTFFIDDKIDTGEVIAQKEIEILPEENAGDLHDKLMFLGSELVVETVQLIQGEKVTTNKQPKKDLKPAPKIFKETCKIDWTDTIDNIYNKIRGLSPYPGAWTYIQNDDQKIEAKIYKASKDLYSHSYPIGQIITSKKEIKVSVKEGFVIIEELQLPGKRKMTVQELLNGYTFHTDAKVLQSL
jgi:methionyl-tRNA formyltransferase